MAAGPAYAAFISYSRAVDGRLAPRLQSALERFGKPWYRLRAIRVFRDDASLSANPGLWSSLTGALDHAEFFVLVASPGSAASEWVDREVEYWLEHRDRARLLIVLTEGEIVWDERTANFDWTRTTALPRALAGAFSEEPRYTDLRFAATSDHLSLRDPRFRDAVADVAAPLNGRAKDDMIGEEVRQHRRTLRIARGAGVLLAALTAAASLAAVLAVRAADRADRERDRAEQEARIATSRQLAAQSAVAVRDARLDAALAQAVRAWRTEHTGQARDALLAALKAARNVEAIVPTRPAEMAVFSADGTRAALQNFEAGTITVHDLADGRMVAEPMELVGAAIGLDRSGTRLAVGGPHGRMQIVDLASGRRRAVAEPTRALADEFGPPVGAESPSFAPGGRRLAWSGPQAAVSFWDGRRTRRLRAPQVPGPLGWTVALGARHLVAAGATGGEVLIWRTDRLGARPRLVRGRPPTRSAVTPGAHGAIAIGPGRRPLVAVGGADDGRVDLREAATGARTRVLRTGRGLVEWLAFSASGRLLTAVDRAGVTVWEVATGRRLARFPSTGAELGAAARDDGRLLAVAFDGTLTVRDLRSDYQLARRLAGTDAFTTPAFDPSGDRIASLDRRGRVRMWRADDGRAGPPLTPKVEAAAVVVLEDGSVVTCCGYLDAPVRVWSTSGASRVLAPETGESLDFEVAPDGRFMVAGLRDDRVHVSDGGRPLVFGRGTHSADLSPDGRSVLVSDDRRAWLWNVPGRRRVAPVDGGFATFNGTGRVLGVDRGGTIELLDPRSGGRVASVPVGAEAEAFAISPDGRRLAAIITRAAAAGAERTVVELWDVDTPRRVGDEPLLADDEGIGTVELSFSPRGDRLLVTGLDSVPLVLDLDVEGWAARACELAPSCALTPSTAAPAERG
jgi:WD40 repeat protein